MDLATQILRRLISLLSGSDMDNPIQTVLIYGYGVMGRGVAKTFADAGFTTLVKSRRVRRRQAQFIRAPGQPWRRARVSALVSAPMDISIQLLARSQHEKADRSPGSRRIRRHDS